MVQVHNSCFIEEQPGLVNELIVVAMNWPTFHRLFTPQTKCYLMTEVWQSNMNYAYISSSRPFVITRMSLSGTGMKRRAVPFCGIVPTFIPSL